MFIVGRKSSYKIGDKFGGLVVVNIISSNQPGVHVKLECHCSFCDTKVIMNGVTLRKRNSCGCQQRNVETWKSSGPKSKPWQLSNGQAARNNVKYGYIRGAAKRGLTFELNDQEFDKLITGVCEYCGQTLTNTKKGQGKTSGDFHYTGIDRIDPTKGYVIDNCVSCCWLCNDMKNNLKTDVFIEHVRKICNYGEKNASN